MRLMLFPSSLRQKSLNKKLIHATSLVLKGKCETDVVDLNEFELPVFNEDIEERSGIPEGVKKFGDRMKAADGVIISSPEYNGGIPGVLKNAIDWASRLSPHPFLRKPILLMGATPGALATVRGLWHTRVPLEALGALVSPDMYGLAHAEEAFKSDGTLSDPKNQKRLDDTMSYFLRFCEATSRLKF